MERPNLEKVQAAELTLYDISICTLKTEPLQLHQYFKLGNLRRDPGQTVGLNIHMRLNPLSAMKKNIKCKWASKIITEIPQLLFDQILSLQSDSEMGP